MTGLPHFWWEKNYQRVIFFVGACSLKPVELQEKKYLCQKISVVKKFFLKKIKKKFEKKKKSIKCCL